MGLDLIAVLPPEDCKTVEDFDRLMENPKFWDLVIEPREGFDVSRSYGSFASLRRLVATSIGVNLDEMQGFKGCRSWDTLKPDPLHLFLNHSDCQGFLSPVQCAEIAPRLRETLDRLNGPEMVLDYGNRIAALMFHCSENGAYLVFS